MLDMDLLFKATFFKNLLSRSYVMIVYYFSCVLCSGWGRRPSVWNMSLVHTSWEEAVPAPVPDDKPGPVSWLQSPGCPEDGSDEPHPREHQYQHHHDTRHRSLHPPHHSFRHMYHQEKEETFTGKITKIFIFNPSINIISSMVKTIWWIIQL